MRISTTGTISTFLLTASAFSPDDLSLTVAHRFVLHAIAQKSSTPPNHSLSETRNLSHADVDDPSNSCSICYDGNDPYHPNRRLQLHIDDLVGSPTDFGLSSAQQEPLTCAEYESAFLTQLFPEDTSCRAFQVRHTRVQCRIFYENFLSHLNLADKLKSSHPIFYNREVWPTSVVVSGPHLSARCVNLE